MSPPLLHLGDAALAARLAARPRLLLFDIDGTLAPLMPRPELVSLPVGTRAALTTLAASPETTVAAVTGRAADDGRRIVDVAGVAVIGNHGMERLEADGSRWVDPAVAPWLEAVAEAHARIADGLSATDGVIVEPKRLTLSVHYRLADPAVVPVVRTLVEEVARAAGLRVTEGKMVLELRPPVAVDKGTASLALAESLGMGRERGGLLFLGDDRTDEDAFRALRERYPQAVTARVGEPPPGEATAAELGLPSPAAVEEFLILLAARG